MRMGISPPEVAIRMKGGPFFRVLLCLVLGSIIELDVRATSTWNPKYRGREKRLPESEYDK